MNLSEKLTNQLYERLSEEYNTFLDELKQMSPEKIIEKSYEKVFKDEILFVLENNDLTADRAKALLARQYPLDEIYQEWLNADCPYTDVLQDCMEDSADYAITEMEGKMNEYGDPLPDPSINVCERNLFGYTYDGMLPLRQERAMELYSQNYCVYKLYVDDTEAMVDSATDITYHNGIFGIEVEDWHTFLEKEQSEVAVQHGKDDVYAIYQLKSGDETRDYRFESIDRLESRGLSVDKNNYNFVYSAPLMENDTLDSLFMKFNVEHPADFRGHSLSVSDIIVTRQDNETKAHYVDSHGYHILPHFFKSEVEKLADKPPAERDPGRKPSVVAQLQTAAKDNNRTDKPKASPKHTKGMEV
jgi:hypothetical protein